MIASPTGTLGIDFGTSNSAIAYASELGTARLIALEGDALAMPTAVFYNAEDGTTHFGREAIGHYLEGTEGRLMRSLKSLLGTPLFGPAAPNGIVSFEVAGTAAAALLPLRLHHANHPFHGYAHQSQCVCRQHQ